MDHKGWPLRAPWWIQVPLPAGSNQPGSAGEPVDSKRRSQQEQEGARRSQLRDGARKLEGTHG